MFKSLEISDWKHFEKVSIDFHPRLTIITGANGSGKSTVIRLLARHVNWQFNELATPEKDETTGILHYFARKLLSSWFGGEKKTEKELGNQIGLITYLDGKKAQIHVSPNQANPRYDLSISGQQGVKGIHVPAYRPQYIHQPIQNYSTTPKTQEDAFNTATNFCRTTFQGGQNQSGHHLKETLLNWMQHGYGNQLTPGIPKYKELYHSFEAKLRTVLPQTIGFEKFDPRNTEIVLVCKSGEYVLDASSGGITALIDLTWQVFLADNGSDNFLVVIDEIENHLHPSMQRSVLSDLSTAFPRATFIVSTHSPFVVGSVEDSAVYALTFNQKNRIHSEKLDMVDKAGTAAEVLRDVLGVPVTYPVWIEKRLQTILQKHQASGLNEATIKALSEELRDAGLANLIPGALTSYLEKSEVKQ